MNRRTPRGRASAGTASPLQAGIARADALIAAGQPAEAAALLAELDRRFHDNPDVLLRLLNLAVAADDVPAVLLAATSLARLRAHDPSVTLNLAIARLKSRHLALARQAFAAFADRWPEHQQAAQARSQANELGEHLAALWAEQGLAAPPSCNPVGRERRCPLPRLTFGARRSDQPFVLQPRLAGRTAGSNGRRSSPTNFPSWRPARASIGATIGPTVCSWLTLVVSGLWSHSYELYTALRALGPEPKSALHLVEELSPQQAAALSLEGREVL